MPFYSIIALDKHFTCGFYTDKNGYITQTAPIIKKFKGQHISMLLKWVGDNELERINDTNAPKK